MWKCPRCGHTSCEEVATTRTQVTAEVACEGCGNIFQRASPGAPWVRNEGDYIGSASQVRWFIYHLLSAQYLTLRRAGFPWMGRLVRLMTAGSRAPFPARPGRFRRFPSVPRRPPSWCATFFCCLFCFAVCFACLFCYYLFCCLFYYYLQHTAAAAAAAADAPPAAAVGSTTTTTTTTTMALVMKLIFVFVTTPCSFVLVIF